MVDKLAEETQNLSDSDKIHMYQPPESIKGYLLMANDLGSTVKVERESVCE